MKRYDSVIIGSGPNGLACGIALAKAGQKVLIMEKAAIAGGGMRTENLTLEGFSHDRILTSWDWNVSDWSGYILRYPWPTPGRINRRYCCQSRWNPRQLPWVGMEVSGWILLIISCNGAPS